LILFGSQSPTPPPKISTKKAAMLWQYARTRVDTTSTIVERAIQYLRRYLETDESEIAPREFHQQQKHSYCSNEEQTDNWLGN
jgi:hypothetical protein